MRYMSTALYMRGLIYYKEGFQATWNTFRVRVSSITDEALKVDVNLLVARLCQHEAKSPERKVAELLNKYYLMLMRNVGYKGYLEVEEEERSDKDSLELVDITKQLEMQAEVALYDLGKRRSQVKDSERKPSKAGVVSGVERMRAPVSNESANSQARFNQLFDKVQKDISRDLAVKDEFKAKEEELLAVHFEERRREAERQARERQDKDRRNKDKEDIRTPQKRKSRVSFKQDMEKLERLKQELDLSEPDDEEDAAIFRRIE